MKKQARWPVAVLWVVACAVLMAATDAKAVPRRGRAIAIRVAGGAEFAPLTRTAGEALQPGMALAEGHDVRTGRNAVVDFVLTTKAVVRLFESTSVRVEKLTQNAEGLPGQETESANQTVLTLEQGQLALTAGKRAGKSSYQVRTPIGVAEATEADFSIWRINNQVTLRVLRGEVTFRMGDRTITVRKGQQFSTSFETEGGKEQGGSFQPVTAPTTDLWARRIGDFQKETEALASLVFEPVEVDVPKLLAKFSIPKLTLVGNPVTETSVSSP